MSLVVTEGNPVGIDAANMSLAATQRPQSPAVAPSGPAAFSTIMATATADAAQVGTGNVARPDFTSMTRKDMFDWMNGKIRNGEMSLDDSSAFLGMTIRIPVGATQGAPVALDNRERVDFVQMTQNGIAGALSRNDDVTRKMLETALQIMRHDRASRVDQRA